MSEVLLTHPTNALSKKSFLDFFPTPKFLLLSSTGLSFSDRGVRVIELKQAALPHEFVLRHSNETSFAEGVVSAGYIYDKPAVTSILKELRSQYSLEYVKATLPEEKAYLFTTELDTEPFASLRDRVAFTIEENAPVSLTNSVFDFEIIGDVKGKSRIKVAVSVLPTKVVETYIEVCEAAGLTPVSFEVESQAIARSVIPLGDSRPHLIINLDDIKTGLYVVEDETVQFSSTSAFGSRSVGGVYSDTTSLKTEIRKVFAFWNTRLDKEGTPQKKIEKIVFVGRGSAKEDLITTLMEDVDTEHSLANPWINAHFNPNYVPSLASNEALGYAGAIGVALPDKDPTYV